MGTLEFMAVILFGYLIGFKPSDLKNMIVLSILTAFGISVGVLVFMVGKAFLLSPNGPYAVAAFLSACFAIWKLGASKPHKQESVLDKRLNAMARKAG